ncbi:hypothetical protein COCVIDRAFT_18713 [Bipolaris victoriae FI3]|uniref:Uncharacterized protein n=1 Tax=Bipolaris victoriae (strain FI3) TaxID=930091 RepID=W7EA00_BIPV3|nr:hypothetical protein COCVIDRAFT_18713 [Bipolaris victoriae FI3]
MVPSLQLSFPLTRTITRHTRLSHPSFAPSSAGTVQAPTPCPADDMCGSSLEANTKTVVQASQLHHISWRRSHSSVQPSSLLATRPPLSPPYAFYPTALHSLPASSTNARAWFAAARSPPTRTCLSQPIAVSVGSPTPPSPPHWPAGRDGPTSSFHE